MWKRWATIRGVTMAESDVTSRERVSAERVEKLAGLLYEEWRSGRIASGSGDVGPWRRIAHDRGNIWYATAREFLAATPEPEAREPEGDMLMFHVGMAQRIDESSWLMGDEFADFRDRYSYAATQTRAIYGLSKVTPEEVYWIWECMKAADRLRLRAPTAADGEGLRQAIDALIEYTTLTVVSEEPLTAQYRAKQRQARARIESLAAARPVPAAPGEQWRPWPEGGPDTAECLAWRPDAGLLLAVVRQTDEVEVGWFTVEGEDLTDDEPTHWMPLPAAPTVTPETPQGETPDAWIVEYRWTKGDPPEWRRAWANAERTTTFFTDRDEAQRAADVRIEDGHDTRIVPVFRRPS